MKQIILGTAGHIDHGKTSLIKAITGTDTDRLKKEVARLEGALGPMVRDVEVGGETWKEFPMPEDAPRAKMDSTRRLGGEVITYDRYTGDREAIARDIAAARGAVVVPSYDHDYIIAGQGTVGLEIAQQCGEQGIVPDQVLVCCGGGGLVSGSAVGLKHHFPDVRVHSVEPEHFDDTARSLRSGKREHIRNDARSICDALQAHSPGELTFAIMQRLLADGVAVSDDEVRSAMRFAFRNLKMVIEPGGAVALAAVLAGKVDTEGKTTVVVASGGNVDIEQYAEIQRSG